MIHKEKLNSAVEIILENILTPILYMYTDEVIEFIVFCDSCTSDEALRHAEELIFNSVGLTSEIVDIREFDDSDRSAVIMNAELVYAESDEVLSMFENAMFQELELHTADKLITMERKEKTGTYFMS